MKRMILTAAVLAAVIAGGMYLNRMASPRAQQAASWLPGRTILFDDLPDLRRSEDRWAETALAQISEEPDVKAFLDRPLRRIPHRAQIDDWLAQFRTISPIHFFFAVTDWTAVSPAAIAGFYYAGDRQPLDSLVDRLRKQAARSWPAGRPDIEKYGSGEIETFNTPAFSAALAYRGRWFFISTDVALLKSTLDRFEGQKTPGSLADLPAFKACLQHLPGAADNLLFMQPALLADKAASLELMLNPTSATAGRSGQALKQISALGAALKLDGEEMRDAAFIMRDQPGDTTPLAKDPLRLSSTDTIIALANRVHGLDALQLPDPGADPSGLLRLLDSCVKSFNQQGLGARELARAFGPESGFLLDWAPGTMAPTPLLMLDVRDRELARKFLDALTTLQAGPGLAFTRRDKGGTSLYSLALAGIGIIPVQITLGLADKCVVGALSEDALRQAVRRWDSRSGLDSTETYRKAEKSVAEPTRSFTYVDASSAFTRIYGVFKGLAAIGFIPHLAEYVDVAKLPDSGSVSRHLTPIVASSSVKDGGLLLESAGPVTLSQAGAAGVLALGAVALPLVEQQLKGQSVPIPGFSLRIPGLKGTGP